MVVAPSVSIREATIEDRPALIVMMAKLTDFEIQFDNDRTGDCQSNAKYFDRINREISKFGGFVLVAVKNDEPIGFAAAKIEDDDEYVSSSLRRYAHISDLFVSVGHRGLGIGGLLIAECTERCTNLGFRRMKIGSLVANDQAAAFYEHWGFRPYATEFVKDVGLGDRLDEGSRVGGRLVKGAQ